MKKNVLFMAAGAALLLSACGGFDKTENGLLYKIHTSNKGTKIQKGDYVTLNMQYRTDADSVLFNTYTIGRPVDLVISESSFNGDLNEGLQLLTENDSATFKINSDSLFSKAFASQRPAFIKPGSFLTFEIKVEKVMPKAELEEKMMKEKAEAAKQEKQAVEEYISKNKLKPLTTESGLQYIIKKQGSGPKPVAGETVIVDYTGKLLDGTTFDSSIGREPIEFPLGQGQVIKGWDEGIALLNTGSKAIFIIPSILAYGDRGNQVIPPFSALVFEVELKGIKK